MVSFGATKESIANLKMLGFKKWVDSQLSLPYVPNMHLIRTIELAKKIHPDDNDKSIEDYLLDNDIVFNKDVANNKLQKYQMTAWFETALNDNDQLRHKMAYALSQIIVESLAQPIFKRRAEALASYFDILTKHSFGNYKDLLLDISYSSSMGLYLTFNGNKKKYMEGESVIYPDENYAREIMQLFTIGLYELNIDGTAKLDKNGNFIETYTQKDVNELARVFTGWDLKRTRKYGLARPKQGDYTHPLEFTEQYHDMGSKVLLNQNIPSKQSGKQDVESAIDILMSHKNIAPFISKQLIMRLAKSNPSPSYVTRVANIFNDNGNGVRGDLKAVLKAIILDDEILKNTGIKKFKEPMMAYTQFLRAFNAKEFPIWVYKKNSSIKITNSFLFNDPSPYLGQAPSRAFSVFNFYSNNYIPNDLEFKKRNLVAPELQIQTSSMLIAFNNKLHNDLLKLEKNYILDKYGTLTNLDIFIQKKYNVAYYQGADKFLLDCSDEYVIEKVLESSIDGKFESFNKVKRKNDEKDADNLTKRDRALKALINHLDIKLTGGLLTKTKKDILFHQYKDVFYHNAISNAKNPRSKIFDKIIARIIPAIITSEAYMVR